MAKRMVHGHPPGPDAARFTATVELIDQLTPTVRSFLLSLDPPSMRFRPGQWVDLHVDDEGTGTRTVGGFTIVSAPADGERGTIELAIKRLGGGRAATFLHDHAVVGDRFSVDGPSGEFFLPDDPGPGLLLIAGGIGINPLMSMVRHVHQTRHSVQTMLIYSAKTPAEFVFREELDAISGERTNITTLFTVTDPGEEGWSGRAGRIDQTLLEGVVKPGGTTYYLCGPPGMPTELARALVSLGAPIDSVRFEEW